MKREETGRYEVSTSAGEVVRAFVPAPLPSVPPLDMNSTRQRRHDDDASRGTVLVADLGD